jgi:hypothetical protein
LFLDDADGATEELTESIRTWNRKDFDLQSYSAVYGLVETALYRQDASIARTQILSAWPRFEGSLLYRWQMLRIMLMHLRGCCAVAAILQDHSAERDAVYCVRALQRETTTWSLAAAASLKAALALGQGKWEESTEYLQLAEDRFSQTGLFLYATACRSTLAQLTGDEQCCREATAWMAERGITNPERMTAFLVPGNWRANAVEIALSKAS